MRPPANPEAEPIANFPLGWYEEFLRELRRLGVVTLTFRDLFRDSDDWDYRSHYRREFKAWQAARDPDAIHLVIQHDVDNHPDFTKRMVALEALHGVRSNIFLFTERATRSGRPAEYDVDHEFFQRAERAGFVIGYHQNALQLCDFDLHAAERRFLEDVRRLRSLYRIEFMVPHGGAGREIDGRMHHNLDVPMPAELEGNLRWVFNRYGATFASRWSDGGIRRCRDPKRLRDTDLVDRFLRRLKPGTRNFCLVHPQRWGFHVGTDENPMLAEQPWYRSVCARYADTHAIRGGRAEAEGDEEC